MAEVVVVGAGLAGLATAARLAKLGHRVTVCERSSEPGGLLRQVRRGGFAWDATPYPVALPAVMRDLFRKSGRPLERYVDLRLSVPGRRHVFADGAALDLPTGSRGGQIEAVTAALGSRCGQAWAGFLDDQADVWDPLRACVLDVPFGAAALGDRATARAVGAGGSLHRVLRRRLPDERLREIAAYRVLLEGRRFAEEPAFRAVEPYVERAFGLWRAPGGIGDIRNALLTRMRERAVEVRFGAGVRRVLVRDGVAAGVRLADGQSLAADVVVTAVAPAAVFEGLLDPGVVAVRPARSLRPSRSCAPRAVTHLALSDPALLPADEVVLHGDPLLVVQRSGSAPEGCVSCTLTAVGTLGGDDDMLGLAARRGLDLRSALVVRVDDSAPDQDGETGGEGSPCGLDWAGPRNAAERARLARPLPGLFCLGTGLVLGRSIPYVAWQAAHVADLIGKTER